MSKMVQIIQEIAVNAEQAGQPVAILYGTVNSTDPLEILVEQKMKIGESMLVLTDEVKDHYVDIDIDFETLSHTETHNHLVQGETTETEGHKHEMSFYTDDDTKSHTHSIVGSTRVLVKNGLKVGERVILLRFQKGQQFLVLSRTR